MIEIMDTTLRDGEQTTGVSFSAHEKLSIAQILLGELGVNRVEIASARVSEGEFEAVRKISRWAERTGNLDKLEVLGFVDGDVSLNWIEAAGCRVVNLLCKGSYKHVTEHLCRTPEEHIRDIRQVIQLAMEKKIEVNLYLEDWSNGIQHSPEYVFQFIDGLKDLPIRRFMLPDTLGVLNPESTYDYCHKMMNHYPDLWFDFHAHNDYDLAVGNVYAAIRAGVKGVHTTVNGLGERAGNAPLSSVLAVIKDQLGEITTLKEEKINRVSRLVETYSSVHIAPNEPIVGEYVFTQCAGVHADGDNKNNLYYNDLLPERFGRIREYALGKTSGKSNIRKNLEALGIDMDDDSMRKVTERITALGDKKEVVTQEDLPYIISDVLNQATNEEEKIRIMNYSLSLAQGLRPVATVKMEINGQAYEEFSSGDGQYDAFVRAVRKIYTNLGRPFPMLTNYSVSIPPGGRTDAFVQTIISWNYAGVDFKTRGLDVDQTESAIKATLKMLNKIEN
ncbi:D-citramalate synthase [Parabacteroides sp. PM5-20]|uniref:alpha-isopropylmalate synthase regulatory domain-containing protein n=1 Tax=unclassified Parabacteroides TaxID=2649774 RepID=UPI0019435452|nr:MULTISPECIES: alpha-isopropylmalate synthase regulatory domain-containing protein [unclassified Parabacteroides]MDH6534087.1 D-citramalate synthase [Parabacteroides sp. PM5-20]